MANIIRTYENRLRPLSQPITSKNLSIKGNVEKELRFWEGKKETSSGAYNRLKPYWDSVGWSTSRWTPSGTPWSAAFITYVLRGNNFPGSASHYAYVENAMQGKGGWKAVSIPKNLGKIQVSIGDVLVRPRSGGHTNSHGDVVYKIQGNKAYLAGGNLSNSAKGNLTVGLDANRMLRSAGDYLILLKKNPTYGDGSTLNKILAYGGLTVSLGLAGLLTFLVAQRKGLIGGANINNELTQAFNMEFSGMGSMNKSVPEMFLSADPSLVSDENLVSVLIYGTTGRKNPQQSAKEMLDSVDGRLTELIGGSFLADPRFNDSSKAKMIAAAELSRRANYRAFLVGKGNSVTTPDQLFRAFQEMGVVTGREEVMAVIFFNVRKEIIGSRIISHGSTRMTLADPSFIISEALKKNARAFALAHNHPSGSDSFSPEDLKICRKIDEAAKCVGLMLMDFLAIGKHENFSSARSQGII